MRFRNDEQLRRYQPLQRRNLSGDFVVIFEQTAGDRRNSCDLLRATSSRSSREASGHRLAWSRKSA
jgi:hypothetical protein